MKRKFLALLFGFAMIVGTSNIAFAEEAEDTGLFVDATEEGGSQYDLTGMGSVTGINAYYGAKVKVDNVEKKYIRASEDEQITIESVVKVFSNSEVTIAGNLDVDMKGTIGTQGTACLQAGDSKVAVKGGIKMIDNMIYALKYDDRAIGYNLDVTGIDCYDADIDIGGNVDIYSKNVQATGVRLVGGECNVHGTISVSSGCDDVFVYGARAAEGTTTCRLIVDEDVNVKGECAIGLEMGDKSTAYVKGNVNVEAAESASGILLGGDTIAVIDGMLSVKTTEKGGQAYPYEPYVAIGTNSKLYVYQYVDKTIYGSSTGITEASTPEEDPNFSHMKYIIRVDDGLTTSAKTFSDKKLGISKFFYAGEGEKITVSSSDGRKIHDIKNVDSNIKIDAHNNGNGTWTITVPRGGGVHLQPVYEYQSTLVSQTDATCSSYGVKAYYKCSCGKYYEDSACTKEITNLVAWKSGDGRIEKRNHDYDLKNSSISWSDDYSKATATFACRTAGCAHKENVNAVVTSATKDGFTTYTATITFGGKTFKDTKPDADGDDVGTGEVDNRAWFIALLVSLGTFTSLALSKRKNYASAASERDK